jgi:hypothetical protein
VDPLYRFSPEAIRHRIGETWADVLEQTRQNRHEFVWTTIQFSIVPVSYEFQRGGDQMMKVVGPK